MLHRPHHRLTPGCLLGGRARRPAAAVPPTRCPPTATPRTHPPSFTPSHPSTRGRDSTGVGGTAPPRRRSVASRCRHTACAGGDSRDPFAATHYRPATPHAAPRRGRGEQGADEGRRASACGSPRRCCGHGALGDLAHDDARLSPAPTGRQQRDCPALRDEPELTTASFVRWRMAGRAAGRRHARSIIPSQGCPDGRSSRPPRPARERDSLPWRRPTGCPSRTTCTRRGAGRDGRARGPRLRLCSHSSARTRSMSPSASPQRRLGLGLDQLAEQPGSLPRERVHGRRGQAQGDGLERGDPPSPRDAAAAAASSSSATRPGRQCIGVADRLDQGRSGDASPRASSSGTPASRSRTASCCDTAEGVNCSASATAAIVPRSCSSYSSAGDEVKHEAAAVARIS